jgi:hypothetical protein
LELSEGSLGVDIWAGHRIGFLSLGSNEVAECFAKFGDSFLINAESSGRSMATATDQVVSAGMKGLVRSTTPAERPLPVACF